MNTTRNAVLADLAGVLPGSHAPDSTELLAASRHAPARDKAIIAGLFLLSLLATFAAWKRITWWTGDSFQYLRLGDNLIRGRGSVGMEGTQNFYFPPVYPLVIGAVHRQLGDPVISGQAVSAIASGLTVVLAYIVGRHWFDPLTALLGAALYAVVPLRVLSSGWVMTEALYGLLVWAAFLAALSRRSVWWGAAAGALTGLAYLTRPEGLFLLAVILGLQLLTWPWEGRRQALRSLLTIVAFTAVSLPYLTWAHAELGDWSLARKTSFNLAFAAAADRGVSVRRYSRFDPRTLQTSTISPHVSATDLLRRYGRNTRLEVERLSYLLGPSKVAPIMIALGLVILLLIAGSGRYPWRYVLEQGLTALPLATLPVLFFSDRFALSAFPLLCLWLAWGLRSLGWLLFRRAGRRAAVPVAAVVLALLVAGVYGYRLHGARSGNLADAQRLATVIERTIPSCSGTVGAVMSAEPAIPYYAGQDWVQPPSTDLHNTVRYARALQVTAVVADRGNTSWPATTEIFANRSLGSALNEVIVRGLSPDTRLLRVRQHCGIAR